MLSWLRSWKDRAIVLATFGVVCLLWLAPLVASFGGVARFIAWEQSQASYFARHDAGLSRGPYETLMVAARFIAHPWGMKWLALPVAVLALAGAARLALRRERRLIPLALVGVPYLVFALLTMDPADAARYIIPFSIVVAGLAGAGASLLLPWWSSRGAVALALVWGSFAFWYVGSILETRRAKPSPPVSAARWAETSLPRDAVILVQPSLMPHGRLLLDSFRTVSVEDGMQQFGTDTETPLWMYVEGRSPREDAAKFWWPASDAYGKITRGHYRAVSLVPFPPTERFFPIEGIHPLEAKEDGVWWRWLEKESSLVVPRLGSSRVEFSFHLPPESPYEEVTLSLYVDERLRAGLPVSRGKTSKARLQMPEGGLLTVIADKTFVPADQGARDTRKLAIMLVGVRQLP